MSQSKLYADSLALLTDFYQITMAYGYWKAGMVDHQACFHHTFRRAPFHGGYAIAAGLENAIDLIENFSYKSDDIAYLQTLENADGKPLLETAFLDYLANLKLTCSISAVTEGTAVFPHEPIMRVEGPLIQAQLLETPLLNILNFQTLIATKASRVRLAAGTDHVMEFGLRRAQGIDGAVSASRAAFIGGCDATSNVLAGKLHGIPVKGTHSHSWVMVFADELEAFETYANQLPTNCVFLVDTYDTLTGVKHAIKVGKRLRESGHEMLGIRLDSGDLAYLSIESRRLLDAAGFTSAQIVASNELDEEIIYDLKRQGATVTSWGVGTNLVTAKGQSALDGVYKLSAVRAPGGAWEPRLKLSEQIGKISTPGRLGVRRFNNGAFFLGDMIYNLPLEDKAHYKLVDPIDATRTKVFSGTVDGEELLIPIFKEGALVYSKPTLEEIRKHAATQIAKLHPGVRRFLNPHVYVVGLEESASHQKQDLIQKYREGFE